MPSSPELKHEITTFYLQRFGVPESFMRDLTIEASKEEIWGGTGAPLPGIHSARPIGLRIGRKFPAGFKPTSVFLAALGSRVSQSKVSIELEDLHKLLLGRRIPFLVPEEGYVALEYRGDILGCGRCHQGRLQALIPTGRRKELLEILSSHT